MTQRLFTDPAALDVLCRRRRIRRLSLFGSTLSGTAARTAMSICS